jgi:hypothetical protein
VAVVERPAGTLNPMGCSPRAPTADSTRAPTADSISRGCVVEVTAALGRPLPALSAVAVAGLADAFDMAP